MNKSFPQPHIANKILKNLKRLFLRRHIREINFTPGTLTFRDCLDILYFLLCKRKDIVKGKYIKQFEDKLAKYVGTKYAFSFGAGRMAFYAILKAIGIGEGGEVILPAYTCVVVPDAVVYCGAKPVYVDINPNTLTIDVAEIEEKITPKTRAILAQHVFASFCDMGAISKIANKHDLRVIEDCAQALGASYQGKKAGTFGDAAFFSTEASKIITTWMGGIAVTNNAGIADRLQEIQDNTEFLDSKAIGRMSLQLVCAHLFSHPSFSFIGMYILWLFMKLGMFVPNINHDELMAKKPDKYPVRLSNIQAKIGLRQLVNIEANLEHRRKLAKIYTRALEEFGVSIYKCDGYNPSHIRFAFLARNREKLRDMFQNSQVSLGEWFNSALHPKGSSLESLHYQTGSCPVAEFMAEHCANLPTGLNVTEKDTNRIIKVLQQQLDSLIASPLTFDSKQELLK